MVANAANAANVEVRSADLAPASAEVGGRLRLLCEALRIACLRLERLGAFVPFGIALDAAEELLTIVALQAAEASCVEDVISLLQTGLEAGRRAGRYDATVLVFETEIPVVGTDRCVRALELRLCDESSASTLCFPHSRERGEVRLEWPHWRGEVSSARLV